MKLVCRYIYIYECSDTSGSIANIHWSTSNIYYNNVKMRSVNAGIKGTRSHTIQYLDQLLDETLALDMDLYTNID